MFTQATWAGTQVRPLVLGQGPRTGLFREAASATIASVPENSHLGNLLRRCQNALGRLGDLITQRDALAEKGPLPGGGSRHRVPKEDTKVRPHVSSGDRGQDTACSSENPRRPTAQKRPRTAESRPAQGARVAV